MYAIFATSGTDISLRWPWGLAVVLALVIATVCGTLIGWFSVRTEGIYTIMITLAIGVAFYYLAQQNYSLFNGFQGFQSVLTPAVFGVELRAPVPFYYLALFWALAGYFFVALSPAGAVRRRAAGHPRQPAAHERARLQRHRAPRRRLRGGRRSSPRWAAILMVWYNGLVSPGSVGTSWLINILIIAVLGGMRHPDRAVHRRHRVRAAAELRRRSGRPRALQPPDRRRVPGHRAVLVRRPARLVGGRPRTPARLGAGALGSPASRHEREASTTAAPGPRSPERRRR